MQRFHNDMTVPQSEPLDDRQVANDAGGYSYEVDHWQRFHRFLILGTEGGTFYATQQKLTRDMAKAALVCLKEDYERYLRTVSTISMEGRAHKNDPALFALALAASDDRVEVRQAALEMLPTVARIGTHLFHFAEYIDSMRGWGDALKRAVSLWYLDKDPKALAYQLCKFKQRDGWSHRDLLRLAHPKPETDEHQALLAWVAGKGEAPQGLPWAMEKLQNEPSAMEALGLIKQYRLTREMVPTELLKLPETWAALNLPYTAMIRNLGNMSKVGYIKPMQDNGIPERIMNDIEITKSKVHPISILAAAVTYGSGKGFRGSGQWPVSGAIIAALEDAFLRSFGNVEPTRKRMLVGIDHSASMKSGYVSGVPGLSPEVASASLSLVWAKTEPHFHALGFGTSYRDLNFHRATTVREAMQVVDACKGEGTDCSIPMKWALQQGIEVDAFVILTDSQTWYGRQHPQDALVAYRRKTGIPAKLVTVAMVPNTFSVADPDDPGTLNVVGFDTASPGVVAEFLR